MPSRQYKVKITFNLNVKAIRAHEIVGIFLEKSASPSAYKKHGNIRKENIIGWRKGMRFYFLYQGAGKHSHVNFYFNREDDADLFREYLNDFLFKNPAMEENEIIEVV